MAVISGTNTVQIPANQRFAGLVIYGNCVQDGTPTPDAPVEIQRVTTLAVQLDGVTQFEIDLQGHDMCGFAEGTRDVLTIDAGGHETMRKKIGSVSHAIADMNNSADWPGWSNSGIRAIVGGGVNSNFDSPNAMSNIKRGGGVFGANTLNSGSDGLFLTRVYHGKTAEQWKSQYPDLVVTIFAKYAEPLDIDLGGTPALDLHAAHTLTVVADVDVEVELTTADFAGGVLR